MSKATPPESGWELELETVRLRSNGGDVATCRNPNLKPRLPRKGPRRAEREPALATAESAHPAPSYEELLRLLQEITRLQRATAALLIKVRPRTTEDDVVEIEELRRRFDIIVREAHELNRPE